jgi:hypothetical protein
MVTLNYLLNKFLPRIDFESYEEFREKFTINVPEDFNFGYDVVDAWAEAEPEKRALVWVNERDEERVRELLDKINAALVELEAEGYFDELAVKYFGGETEEAAAE